jgi:hypothetical protein
MVTCQGVSVKHFCTAPSITEFIYGMAHEKDQPTDEPHPSFSSNKNSHVYQSSPTGISDAQALTVFNDNTIIFQMYDR